MYSATTSSESNPIFLASPSNAFCACLREKKHGVDSAYSAVFNDKTYTTAGANSQNVPSVFGNSLLPLGHYFCYVNKIISMHYLTSIISRDSGNFSDTFFHCPKNSELPRTNVKSFIRLSRYCQSPLKESQR